MPTPHIAAAAGDVAPLVLMPGDPRRADKIAQNVLTDARLVTEVRGVTGWTGTYDGTPITVMASGMGIPSISIYATELYRSYGVQRIIRVGTCGAISRDVAVRDVVVATAAHSDSSVAHLFVPDVTLSLAPSFALLRGLVDAACAASATVHTGPVYTSDHFYLGRTEIVDSLDAVGTLAVEMEAAGLFAVALREHREAAAVLTVSDHLRGGAADLTAEERETCFDDMVHMAAKALTA